jgi:hypothetical protein
LAAALGTRFAEAPDAVLATKRAHDAPQGWFPHGARAQQFGISELYRRLGRLDSVTPWPASVTRRAIVQLFVEYLLTAENPHGGDELVLIANK